MASSQVEMASSPYEHVLRDYNRRVRDREVDINSRSLPAFKKNFKDLVRDHFQPCNVLAFPRDPYAGSDENYHQQEFENRDCWVRDDDRNSDNFGSGSNRGDTGVESPAMARRNSQILDRWAARQAREMITTLERQAREDELTQLSNSQTVSTRASSFQRDSMPAPPDSSVDLANLRASSLVQMWKEFEAEVKSPTATANQSGGSVNFRINSTLSNASVDSELFESNDERYGAQEDSSTDWESDLTAPSEHFSSSNGPNSSDISERVRVADIIRKLTSRSQTQSPVSWSDEIEHDHHESMMTESSSLDHSVSNLGGQRNLRFIGNMPRVRGRQAIIDLMKQMEQERLREIAILRDRHAVSRFTQRGRIQSLLRLRFLRQRDSVQDQHRPVSTASELDRLHRQTTIFVLRERFNQSVRQQDEVMAVLSGESNLTCTDLPTETLNSENSSNAVENSSQDFHQQEVAPFEQNNNPKELHPMASPSEHLQEEARGISDLTWQGTSSGVSDLDSQGHVEIAETSHNREGHDEDTAVTLNDREGGDEIIEETDLDTSQHVVESVDSWEGLIVPEEPHFAEPTDMSWISNDSGPQINWEGHRPAWFYEMPENNSDNEEIRELLGRRSVSNLLASGFRARMERLVLSYLRRQRHEEVVESAEEENHFEHQYHEVQEDYAHVASTSLQLPLPSQLRSWSQYQDHEVSNDSDHVPSTPLQGPQSDSYYHDSRQFPSFTNHSSLEMELICDLRGHLAKLHQEMVELRKSMESCMGMQVMLQNSIKQEVAAAVCHSIQGEAKEFFKQGPMQKGNCCICYDMKVDSLLYRCGHMCTCFNCASELQWSSSRCPICRAPILDVVRAYPDT